MCSSILHDVISQNNVTVRYSPVRASNLTWSLRAQTDDKETQDSEVNVIQLSAEFIRKM
jgi:hypothetical protein